MCSLLERGWWEESFSVTSETGTVRSDEMTFAMQRSRPANGMRVAAHRASGVISKECLRPAATSDAPSYGTMRKSR